jgi:hypothetical protein
VRDSVINTLELILAPQAKVERSRGYSRCAVCGREILNIYAVNGEHYGSTCYRDIVRRFDEAVNEQLAERRRTRRERRNTLQTGLSSSDKMRGDAHPGKNIFKV